MDSENLFIPYKFDYYNWYIFRQEKGKFVQEISENKNIVIKTSTHKESDQTETFDLSKNFFNTETRQQHSETPTTWIGRYNTMLLNVFKNQNPEEWKKVVDISRAISKNMMDKLKSIQIPKNIKMKLENMLSWDPILFEYTIQQGFLLSGFLNLNNDEKMFILGVQNDPELLKYRDEMMNQYVQDKPNEKEALNKFRFIMGNLSNFE
jgi:hypothetical protein